MTRLTKTAALVAATFAVPSFVLADTVEVDANGDGLLSVAELQTVYPEITGEQFSVMDLNADGGLDAAEIQGAGESGMLPTAPAEE
ncbi:hypothetical protein DSM110093_01540 [Sulfitobacter sp. DSM 110093]|uniref:hypothetical protein n=1 Tax=Sulfitobacter sp. DSM 110093 TaxID=2883127 RepID=UPI001FAD96B7|nr:hypothetical protein [Sulfitobacter sp. DSM 110093]UOA31767.1 hypothetical protein DSM110093_01540 [Sulfitobacter sp. DSM 110093]